MNLTNKIAVIAVSDLHINSTVAICPPTVNLDDGGTYRASRPQRALWESLNDFTEQAKRISEGMTRLVLFNGDMGELDTKRRSTQLISQNKATIISIVLDTIAPLVEIADHVIVTRGTMAHVGKASWLEEAIAADLDNVIPAEASKSHYHARFDAAGVKFDVAHHGKMGGVPWTFKNAGNRLAAETMWNYSANGWPLPDVVIRSHNHRRADSGRNYKLFAMFTPAWQLATEFSHRIGAENALADIGGDVFICEGGRYTWHPFDYKPKETRIWALKI